MENEGSSNQNKLNEPYRKHSGFTRSDISGTTIVSSSYKKNGCILENVHH